MNVGLPICNTAVHVCATFIVCCIILKLIISISHTRKNMKKYEAQSSSACLLNCLLVCFVFVSLCRLVELFVCLFVCLFVGGCLFVTYIWGFFLLKFAKQKYPSHHQSEENRPLEIFNVFLHTKEFNLIYLYPH